MSDTSNDGAPKRQPSAWFRNHKWKLGAATAALALAVIGASVYAARPDVVNGVRPVSASLQNIDDTMRAMATLRTDQERGRYLEQHWPHLDRDVIYFLRRNGKLAENVRPTRVDFHYGSLEHVRAETGTGDTVWGYARNQLIAIVHLPNGAKPIIVFVQCLNGTFATLDDVQRLGQVGSHTPIEQFEIARGEGLVHHIDYPTAMDVGQRFGLPVYKIEKKEGAKPELIDYNRARALEPETDEVRVIVWVYPGDRFDLATGTYDPAAGPPIRR